MSTKVQIKPVPLSRMSGHVHFQFNSDIVRIILAVSAEALNIVALFITYLATVNREDEALKKIVKSDLTKKISAADKERDNVYSSITSIIKTTLKHYNKEVVDAAERLKIVVDTYGAINSMPLDAQTSAVYNILQEFKGKYAADIALIRITEMIDELERTNNAVDALIKQRTKETSQQNTDTMKITRKEVDKAYLAIHERINAAIIMEGPENYAEFVREMNATIDRYKNLLARSKGKKKDGNAETGAGDEEGDDNV